jgi:predicted anti-sigma-YlaC factor YlaD
MARKLVALCCLLAALTACSMKRIAVNKIGDSLASGGSTFEQDEDPELVAQALPFGLKLMESLLAESPKHPGLLMAVASGFTEYSYAFVETQAEETRAENLERSDALKERARKLYLRAHNYGLRGLEARYPGFTAAVDQDAAKALARVRKRDIATLYWTAASLGLAISGSKDNPEMIGRLPLVEAMINRVAELDEGWNAGSVPEFLITLEASRSGVAPEEQQKVMRKHFERSLELSKGTHASAFVSFAENACVPAQNAAEFRAMLEKALAVDTDKPENRLANLIAKRRARWLLGRIGELFLEPGSPAPEPRT